MITSQIGVYTYVFMVNDYSGIIISGAKCLVPAKTTQ